MLNIFVIQRPQWKNNPVKNPAADQDPANLFDEDLDEIYQDADIPNVGHHEAGTTASEFDGALDELEDEDEDVPVKAVKVDESDEDSEPKRRKSTKKVCSQLDTSLLYRSHLLKECYRSVCRNVMWHVCQK
jgi:hypothetical protein